MTPHPYAEILRAIADGKQVQRRVGIDKWCDVDRNYALYYIREATMHLGHTDLRIKPEPKKERYRVAEMRIPSTAHNYTTTADDGHGLERSPNFIRWLTDWIEYEVSE